MNERITSLSQLAGKIESINQCLAETQGRYVTFHEAVLIARTVYNTNLNSVIDTAVRHALVSTQVLLTDVRTTIEAVEQYRSCPCQIDLRQVYKKHMKQLLFDADYYPSIVKDCLEQIEQKYAVPDFPIPQKADKDEDEEDHDTLEKLLLEYKEVSDNEAKARLELYVNRGKYRFMEGISPDVIDMFMNKVVEICNSIIAELAAKGIIWKDPRNDC